MSVVHLYLDYANILKPAPDHDLDLFGPNPGDQAAKNRAVYFLLRVCLELET